MIGLRKVTFFLLASIALTNAAVAQNNEVSTAGACKNLGGTFQENDRSFPGDGNVYDMSVSGPNGASDFLGGYLLAKVDGVDNSYKWSCPLNPEQPPTVANTGKRRCKGNAADTSIEHCESAGGNTPSFSCTLAIEAGHPSHSFQLYGCWK